MPFQPEVLDYIEDVITPAQEEAGALALADIDLDTADPVEVAATVFAAMKTSPVALRTVDRGRVVTGINGTDTQWRANGRGGFTKVRA
ncbi:MAG: hypothetical protein Q7T61_00980 [Caulobacter sp.]|nr:hypothetical protein [Caulobacter sp.]